MRLIDADALVERTQELEDFFVTSWTTEKVQQLIYEAPTVDAVHDDLKEFANDVAYQFGYYCQNKGRLCITPGGLSTLEWAFEILEWDDPHPVPECECEIEGCHEHATCGAPTKYGYKRMCGKHFRQNA